MTEHPEITIRESPTGPRAALIDGPDVWEVIQTIDSHPSGRKVAVPATAELLNLTEQQVRAAIDYRATNREEIDARIKLNALAWHRQAPETRTPRFAGPSQSAPDRIRTCDLRFRSTG